MPRYPRSYIQTSHYHVITQGINKKYIFKEDEDKKFYIKIMYKESEEKNIEIVAYCVMDNHVHMLLKVNNLENLSKYMHKINTQYGIYYNKKYKRVGYVFRDRYRAEGIYSERQLYACIAYIYNNPIKAKICDNPIKYQYSNCKKIYELDGEDFSFIDVEEKEEEIINDYFLSNGIIIEEVLNDPIKLKELIRDLKENRGISLRKIAQKLNLNRERVRKIYKE